MSPAAMTGRRKRVYISGMFDMLNFGDLLFPLVAAFRLGIDVVPVAPTAIQAPLADALKAIDIAQMFSDPEPIDGILIGGGYTIHNHRLDMLEHYRIGDLAEWAAPGLWLGATLAAVIRDVPAVWNAPGVPHPFPSNRQETVAMALRAANYVSVRDRASVELLVTPQDVEVHVVPDTIAELARMWPMQILTSPFKELLARKQTGSDANHVAIHVRNRSISGVGTVLMAKWIDDFAGAHGLIPILIAVGQSHNDDVLARELSKQLRARHILLDDPVSLVEIAAAIGCSSLYVGASLHGYIAAAAYGVPGILVAKPAYGKFAGILQHLDRPQDLARDWPEAFTMASGRLKDSRGRIIPDHVFAALDTHWQRIGATLSDRSAKRVERGRFLQFYFQTGVEREGGAWTQRPFMSRRPRAAQDSLQET